MTQPLLFDRGEPAESGGPRRASQRAKRPQLPAGDLPRRVFVISRPVAGDETVAFALRSARAAARRREQVIVFFVDAAAEELSNAGRADGIALLTELRDVGVQVYAALADEMNRGEIAPADEETLFAWLTAGDVTAVWC